MLYELVNPSDAISFDVDDDHRLALCVGILMLGRGRFALTDAKGEKPLPLMLFGGADHWIAENIPGGDLDAWFEGENLVRVAEALETALYGHVSDREAIVAAIGKASPEETRAAFARFSEVKRTSMNDICGACHSYAKKLRAAAATKPEAQV